MTNQEISKTTTRANKIASFTFTNQFETESAWLIRTMKKYISTHGKPSSYDESDLAFVWHALVGAFLLVEDVRAENKRNS
tara:strand:+ start:42 stop:281 length:240 start_codon:yes stop_codon:yes gene_type:complete